MEARVGSKWDYESEIALRAVSMAGQLIQNSPDNLKINSKSSFRDIVTNLDVAVEGEIVSILRETGHPIIGEESYFLSQEKRLPSSPFWCVDPIDGTVNFVSGIPIYAVSVGLFDKECEAGAVSIPCAKELYFTHGGGAYLNGTRLKISDCDLRSALVVECFSGRQVSESLRRSQYELFAAINDSSRGCLRLGSAAASICYAASGRLQGVCGVDSEIWDVAAGLAIAAAAGCKVLFSRGASSKVNFIVGSPSVVDELRLLCQSKGVMRL